MMYVQKQLVSVTPKVPTQSDYYPWQRTSRSAARSATSAVSTSPSTKSNENVQPTSMELARTACSSVCRHSWNKKSTTITNVGATCQKKQRILALLKMQIKAKENTLLEYKKHYQQLLNENIRIKDEIRKSESATFQEATVLLQCYKQYRGSIGTLNKQYSNQLAIASEDFRKTKEKLDQDIKEIQVLVDNVSRQLLVKKSDATTLLHYKDKEYSEKALYISKLKKKRDKLMKQQKEDMEELYNTIRADKQKCLEKEKHRHDEIKYDINEEAANSVNTNIKEIGLQNMIMKKEIEIHENEILDLEDINKNIETEIRRCLQDKSLNPVELLFPDIFQCREKCKPHDNICLDIPHQKWLPL